MQGGERNWLSISVLLNTEMSTHEIGWMFEQSGCGSRELCLG